MKFIPSFDSSFDKITLNLHTTLSRGIISLEIYQISRLIEQYKVFTFIN